MSTVYKESSEYLEELGEDASYLKATTYGIGELITQRKLFRVPEHQRDFAWDAEEVRQFFDDIRDAWDRNDPDYFIGLIVLLGPYKRTWQILDGQQRLATTTMIYSAIRNWLVSHGFDEDAKQVATEFIQVRHLGGDYSPRLVLNVANRDTFHELVVNRCPQDEIEKRLKQTSKKSSNSLLMQGAIICRKLVNEFTEDESSDLGGQASCLDRLMRYLETRVRAVVLDVSSRANAFVIFESLNARGNELSTLDLVKNFVFGQASHQDLQRIRQDWDMMAGKIDDKDADDFLKVFWTSHFGRIQKQQLYKEIQKEYTGSEGVKKLAYELQLASEQYDALDNPTHEIWSTYDPVCSRNVKILSLLGNRQVRAPIMSAIDMFDEEQMKFLLWSLVVLTVRYQTVGKRRTGALEITMARVAHQIRTGQIKTEQDFLNSISAISQPDEEFHIDFSRFSDRKASRVRYFLVQLEMAQRINQGLEFSDLEDVDYYSKNVSVEFILPRRPVGDWEQIIEQDPELVDEWLYRLGNRCLLEGKFLNQDLGFVSFARKVDGYYRQSDFLLTQTVGAERHRWTREELRNRQILLADLAVQVWTFDR